MNFASVFFHKTIQSANNYDVDEIMGLFKDYL